jgi:hypothetical protein
MRNGYVKAVIQGIAFIASPGTLTAKNHFSDDPGSKPKKRSGE